MNWLTVLFSFFLKIRSCNGKLEIKQAYLLENNFWDYSKRCVEAGEGYLYSLKFIDESNKKHYFDFEADDCFYLNCAANNRYVEISEHLAETIFCCSNYSKVLKNFVRVRFLTTDCPVKDREEYKNYKGKRLYDETHMWAEKSTDNDGIINLKCDEDKSRIIYIKEKFKLLIGERLYKFIDRTKSYIPLTELEKNKDFKLCRFSNYRKCYQSFKIFLKNSEFFGLSENDKNEEDTNKAIMNPTKFMQSIDKMIKEDLEESSGDAEKSMFCKFCERFVCGSCESKDVLNKKAELKIYKILIKKCFDDLKCKMLEKKIFFNVGGVYDVDYYFKELYNQANKAVYEYKEDYHLANLEDKNSIFQEICKLFYDSLKKLQKKVIDELFESDYIHEQFSKLLGEDFKTPDGIFIIENSIFDYLNLLTYLCKFCKISGESYFYKYDYPLNFNYSYECKVVSYLKITLKTQFSNDFGKIEAYNEKCEKVEFIRNIHFFLKHHLNCEFYCTSEVLRKLNVKKIKITTLKDDFCKIIKVDNYLRY